MGYEQLVAKMERDPDVRIAVVGDSIIWGGNAERWDTLSAELQELYRSQGRDVSAYNLGMNGAHANDMLPVIAELSAKNAADVILVNLDMRFYDEKKIFRRYPELYREAASALTSVPADLMEMGASASTERTPEQTLANGVERVWRLYALRDYLAAAIFGDRPGSALNHRMNRLRADLFGPPLYGKKPASTLPLAELKDAFSVEPLTADNVNIRYLTAALDVARATWRAGRRVRRAGGLGDAREARCGKPSRLRSEPRARARDRRGAWRRVPRVHGLRAGRPHRRLAPSAWRRVREARQGDAARPRPARRRPLGTQAQPRRPRHGGGGALMAFGTWLAGIFVVLTFAAYWLSPPPVARPDPHRRVVRLLRLGVPALRAPPARPHARDVVDRASGWAPRRPPAVADRRRGFHAGRACGVFKYSDMIVGTIDAILKRLGGPSCPCLSCSRHSASRS